MVRMAVCVAALAATLLGQQQAPKPTGDIFGLIDAQSSAKQSSGEITADPSEVTPAPPEGIKSKSQSKVRGSDMGPVAVCARDMDGILKKLDADRGYIGGMEPWEREQLSDHAQGCLFLQRDPAALRHTAVVLGETKLYTGFFQGVESGTKQANQAQDASKTAVCQREILAEFDEILKASGKTSMGTKDFAQIGEAQRERMWKQAYDCLEASGAAGVTAWILEQASWYRAYNAASERDKADYNALVNDYNSLVDRYDTLLGVATNLASRPTVITVPSFIPPPPPRELYRSCTAMALPGNMTTINCW
jgi:hypothetical protein